MSGVSQSSEIAQLSADITARTFAEIDGLPQGWGLGGRVRETLINARRAIWEQCGGQHPVDQAVVHDLVRLSPLSPSIIRETRAQREDRVSGYIEMDVMVRAGEPTIIADYDRGEDVRLSYCGVVPTVPGFRLGMEEKYDDAELQLHVGARRIMPLCKLINTGLSKRTFVKIFSGQEAVLEYAQSEFLRVLGNIALLQINRPESYRWESAFPLPPSTLANDEDPDGRWFAAHEGLRQLTVGLHDADLPPVEHLPKLLMGSVKEALGGDLAVRRLKASCACPRCALPLQKTADAVGLLHNNPSEPLEDYMNAVLNRYQAQRPTAA